jgi:thiamine transport system substrate-binding protein
MEDTVKQRLGMVLLALLALTWSGCAAQDRELVVMTHDSFDIGEETIAAFEEEYGVEVTFLKSGDAGEALNRAILSEGSPLADVFYGVDNTFMSRALEADIFMPSQPDGLANVPGELILDPEGRLVPVDWGDVCLNVDLEWFEGEGLAPPATLEDLTRPDYRGLTVVENPATSSPGLAFLLTTIGTFGQDGYEAYWRALRENDVWVENGWSEAYYGQFSAASDGNRPIVVSYATSPAAEVYFSEGAYDQPPTAAVLAAGTCFRQIEFAGVLRGTRQRRLAEAFIEWMLDRPFQEDIPLHMWVYPANQEAELPEVFRSFAQEAEAPVTLSPGEIAESRETWVENWTEIVLR